MNAKNKLLGNLAGPISRIPDEVARSLCSVIHLARDKWLSNARLARSGSLIKMQLFVHVDKLPEGFYFIQSESGSNFNCSSCDSPASGATDKQMGR